MAFMAFMLLIQLLKYTPFSHLRSEAATEDDEAEADGAEAETKY
jgi:hypothetical protein